MCSNKGRQLDLLGLLYLQDKVNQSLIVLENILVNYSHENLKKIYFLTAAG